MTKDQFQAICARLDRIETCVAILTSQLNRRLPPEKWPVGGQGGGGGIPEGDRGGTISGPPWPDWPRKKENL